MKYSYVSLLFFLSLFFVGLAEAGDIHTVAGTSSGDIQKMLNEADTGDIVFFPAGEYELKKRVYVKGKDLTLEGEEGAVLNLDAGSECVISLQGSLISSQTLPEVVYHGSKTIILTDASKVSAGDLIKIWNQEKWCPKDYREQTTGELYKIESINGDAVTLNEPLLRDYPVKSKIKIIRPVEIHVKNLIFVNSDSKGTRDGLELKYCVDSSVSDCVFQDNGRAALRINTCWNTVAEDNEIYDGVHTGNGYGVSIADASAYITIEKNHIENCRHCIMSGTADFEALNRKITISNNVLIGASIKDSFVVDSHEMTLDYTVTGNEIYVQPGFAAFQDGTLNSVFTGNEIYGGREYRKRGHVDGGTHVIRNTLHDAAKYTSMVGHDAAKYTSMVGPDAFRVLIRGFSFPLIETDMGASATVIYNNVSYDPHSLIEVSGDDLKLIKYEYGRNTTRYFIEKEIWTGDIEHIGDELYIQGPFNVDSLKITVYSEAGFQKVSDIKIIERKLVGASSVNPDLFIFVTVLAILGISITRNIRRII